MRDNHFLPAADPEFVRLQAEINGGYQAIVAVALVAMLAVVAVAAVVGPRNWQAVRDAHQAEVV